jgi:hypothetical protein
VLSGCAGGPAALSAGNLSETRGYFNQGNTYYEEGELAACCTCGFFALDAAKNPRLSGCADLWSERSL